MQVYSINIIGVSSSTEYDIISLPFSTTVVDFSEEKEIRVKIMAIEKTQ